MQRSGHCGPRAHSAPAPIVTASVMCTPSVSSPALKLGSQVAGVYSRYAGAMLTPLLALAALHAPQDRAVAVQDRIEQGGGAAAERLDPGTFGPSVVEGMDAVLARANGAQLPPDPRRRNGAPGEWTVPPRGDASSPNSGERYVFNSWGEPRLGVGFRRKVRVQGLWLAKHGGEGATAPSVQVVGYLDGLEVGRTKPSPGLTDQGLWWALELPEVDRVVFLAEPAVHGAGWFAIDDLTFSVEERGVRRTLVADFEDLNHGESLTGSGYFDLDWETGSRESDAKARPSAPVPAAGSAAQSLAAQSATMAPPAIDQAPTAFVQAPGQGMAIDGPRLGDTGTLTVPDTNGAAGPDHYVAAPNGHLSIYSKASGQRLLDVAQTTFFATGGILGDPRVAYDSGEDRFVLIASDWDSRVYLAYSMTADPTGAWFKTSFVVTQGADAGSFPDYPTLGLDEHGIYTSLFMAPGGMSIFAIDKQPLLAASPSLGTVTAWRSLPIEGAIQPCVTFGSSDGPYLVSRSSNQSLRIRQITGSLTAPSLVEKGLVTVPTFGNAPDVPQLGTGIRLSTSTARPMNAVYRAGSLWTAHCIDVAGRAGVRWYQIDPEAPGVVQLGTIAHPVRSFFMPSIAVNAAEEVALGFTASSPSEYASVYATGRKPSDPAGTTADPVLVHAGLGPYTLLDIQGVSRWGDYSVTGVDPIDDSTFWTIQQYARPANQWGLWIQALSF